MDLLNQLMQQLKMPNEVRFEDGSIGKRKPAPQARPQGSGAPARRQSPGVQLNDTRQFKMYEDQSFQGDPRQFMQQNPGYQFYEDGSFAPPKRQRVTPGYERQAQAYEQAMASGDFNSPSVIGVDPRHFGYAPDGPVSVPLGRGDSVSAYQDNGINSVSGRFGEYGGTIGNDNGRPFANMNRNGQQTDPLDELRKLLGF